MEHEVAPPEGLLESVQNEILARKVRKRWILSACAASIALLAGISAFYFAERIDQNVSGVPKIAGTYTAKEFQGTVSKTSGVAVAMSSVASPVSTPTVSNGERGVVVIEDQKSEDNALTQDIEDKNCEDIPPEEFVSRIDSDPQGNDYYAADVDVKNRNRLSDVSVGLSASANGLGGMICDADPGVAANRSASQPMTRMGGGGLSNSPTNDIQTPPSFVEMFDHKLPLRFSLDFSLPVCRDLYIGTGITYSYLRSDISYGYSDSRLMKAHQNLHYLGIPVNLRYAPFHFRNLDIYLSAGFMAEKCVAGNINEETATDVGYSYPGCNDRPFQFSVNAAAGVQYNLTRQCGIYIEPGAGVYLKNGSMLRSIYTEKPVTFNLNIGLRFGK